MARKGGGNKRWFYGVHAGRRPGVYELWEDASDPSNPRTAKAQTDGFPRPIHKKFATRAEAEAFAREGYASTSKAREVAAPYPSTGTRQQATVRAEEHPLGKADIIVWTDGACSNNGKKGCNIVAGVGVHWEQVEGGPPIPSDLSERLPGVEQTNNKAELFAIIRALETEPDPTARLTIKTDSQYSISCIEEWMKDWDRRAGPDGVWRAKGGNLVANQDMLKYLRSLLARREASRKRGVHFVKVAGHSGVAGNERADRLANQGALLPARPERDFTVVVSGPMDGFVGRAASSSAAFDEYASMLASAEELEEELREP